MYSTTQSFESIFYESSSTVFSVGISLFLMEKN